MRDVGAVSTTPPAERLTKGCGLALAIGVCLAIVAGVAGWRWYAAREAEAEAARLAEAEEVFAPARATLEGDKGELDIDRTVRVLRQIDESMRNQADLHAYLAEVAREDWRGVPREVLDARRQILDVQMKLYAKQDEQEAREASWSLSRDIVLTTLSVVSVQGDGGLAPDIDFQLDREAAEARLDELREEEAARRELIREIDALESELIKASMDYAVVWAKYMEEYDRVSLHRDRAWMASRREDWAEVEREAQAAIALAPREEEAHLLLARAYFESGEPEKVAMAEELLGKFLDEHPDSAAPVFLLRGVARANAGDLAGAAAEFDHASLAYPQQAAKLESRLDLYRARSTLRKSRAGAGIVESYSATMVGAGYFSPELHLARLAYARGDREAGKRKVVEHFERRRAQGQWDYILADLSWAEAVLGDDLRGIFPEDAWLDLHANKTLLGLGQKFSVAVDNRSQRTLRNAALVLCVRFTDMLSGDYVTFAGERTVPEVLPRQETDFGTIDIDTEVFGKTRTEDDIVDLRAILVTDDGVMWVDTDKYKAERVAEARAAKANEPDRWARIAEEAGRAAKVSRDSGLVTDALEVELPAEMAWLRPRFELHYGSAVIYAEQNVIEDDKIKLRFTGLTSLLDRSDVEKAPPPKAADLVVESVFGRFVLGFGPKPGGGWEFLGVRE